VQYVEIKAADLANDIQVVDADINAYYQANLSRYQGEERRRVSHILLESAEDNADVKAKAEAILKELQAGADFAKLAKQHSADTVSAENGGDLDFITKGVMEPEFETAAYALAKSGDLSAVVKTSFGYHIIQLTEVEAAKVKTIDEVKATIVAAIKTEKSAEKFAELQQKLAEVSFEVADNLEEAATAVGAKVQSAALFSRASASGVLNNPKFLDTVFNADFISAGTNSEVVELGPQHVAVARLVEHLPAKNKSFEDVKSEVQTAYVAEQAAELAQQKAAALLKELQAGKAISELVTANALTLENSVATPRFGGSLSAEVRTKAFELAKPTKDKAVSFGSTKLQNGDAALVLVSKVTDIPAQGEPGQAELDNLANQLSQSHFAIVQKALRERAEISRNLAVLTASTEQQ
jgi:peptidyl-prolyl cis-trans isomerase D